MIKPTLLIASAMMLAAGLDGWAATPKGVEVNHLGVNNTLVRVNADGKYLILPVQESNDEATVNVLVDGNIEKTIYVRLAKTKVDYTVPLRIDQYDGHQVTLNVVTQQSRSSVREAKGDVCWASFAVADTFDTANRERFRPAYHHTPLYGWMNDPNGMVYADGLWHLFFQHNPYGSKWQNMTWGHSTSADLINWQHLDNAIEGNGLGSVFSGNAVIDHQGTAGFGKGAVIALYTSAGVSQIQSLAYSTDGGNTFNIYPGNPVLTLESEARDPKMFWNDQTGEWNLVLAHALEHEMLFFSSPDLKHWTLNSAFGKGLGCQEGVWECPDLFKLPVEGSDEEKWVLICNINPGGPFGGSATQYFIGDYDGHTFTPDRDAQGQVPTKWMDYGKDHYATVSWSNAPDGRRVVIGWMSNWQYAAEVPTMQYRSANTLPRECQLFRAPDGQVYLASKPAAEVDALRDRLFKKASRLKSKPMAIPELCEIKLEIDPKKATEVALTLANSKGEKVVMTYNAARRTMAMDRSHSGISDFSQDFPAVTTATVLTDDDKLTLRIFIDRSSIELFEQQGRLAMTNIVFPSEPYNSLTVSTTGGKADVKNVEIYSISENHNQ